MSSRLQVIQKTGLSRQQFFDELRGLIENEYFTRAWTVQEIAVSKKCLVLCGTSAISWTIFGIAARCISPEIDSEAEKRQSEVFRSYMIHWMLWKRFRQSITGDQHAGLHNDGLEECDISDVLHYSRYQHATKRKDKVWALYGVFQELGLQLQTDYESEELEIFTAATFEVIKKSGSLKVFLTLPEHQRSSELPSWVPDWTQDYPFKYHLRLDQFKACGASKCSPAFIDQALRPTLILKGKAVGRIEKCLPGNLEDWDEYAHRSNAAASSLEPRLWQIRLVQEWMRMALPQKSDWKGSTVLRCFFHTMEPMIQSRKGPDPDYNDYLKLALFCDFWRTSTSGQAGFEWIQSDSFDDVKAPKSDIAGDIPADGDDANEIWRRVSRDKHRERYLNVLIEKMSNYSLFKDTSDRVGIAFHAIRPGSEIMLLAGASAPVVMSRCETRYQVVAPAYINGLMNGQEWPSNDESLDVFEIE